MSQPCLCPPFRRRDVICVRPSVPRFQEAGIEPGDTLQEVDGVKLGTYKDGVEIFKKLRGPVVLTVLRQNDEIMI